MSSERTSTAHGTDPVIQPAGNRSMQSSFNQWLSGALPKRKPEMVVAYNFNIAETETQYIVDLIGSREYSPDDEDWACDESWTSRPKIFQIPKQACGDWNAAIVAVKNLVTHFMQEQTTLLNDATAVTVGFVDGNLDRVWPSGN